jgi:hypothetical protein
LKEKLRKKERNKQTNKKERKKERKKGDAVSSLKTQRRTVEWLMKNELERARKETVAD